MGWVINMLVCLMFKLRTWVDKRNGITTEDKVKEVLKRNYHERK
jgi:hypothetical protein